MLKPSWYPDDKQLRQFAGIALIGFALIGYVFHWRFGWTTGSWVLAGIGAVTCIAGLASPRSVLPIYGLLMLITLPIGWVVSNIFLYLLYYVVLTPVALFFRAMGRDALVRRRPQAASYWQAHRQPADLVSYYRQS